MFCHNFVRNKALFCYCDENFRLEKKNMGRVCSVQCSAQNFTLQCVVQCAVFCYNAGCSAVQRVVYTEVCSAVHSALYCAVCSTVHSVVCSAVHFKAKFKVH